MFVSMVINIWVPFIDKLSTSSFLTTLLHGVSLNFQNGVRTLIVSP